MDIGLYFINGVMGLAVLFGVYITQEDRKYWCKKQMEKLWKR